LQRFPIGGRLSSVSSYCGLTAFIVPFGGHHINRNLGQQRKIKQKVAYSIGFQKNHLTPAYDWYPTAKTLDCLAEIAFWKARLLTNTSE
jgi:hypothetical protein